MIEFIYNGNSNNIRINGDIFEMEDFLEVIPTFNVSSHVSYIEYIPSKKYNMITTGREECFPPVWDEGDFYISKYNDLLVYVSYKKSLRPKKKKNEYIIDENDSYDVKRKKEYPQINDLVVSLWEHIVEGKSLKDSGIEQLDDIRKSIKLRFPKK